MKISIQDPEGRPILTVEDWAVLGAPAGGRTQWVDGRSAQEIAKAVNEIAVGAADEKTQSGAVDRIFDLDFLRTCARAVQDNITRVVQGKDEVVQRVILALLSDGHVLVEDVPGVGKTMLAHALAKSIRADFKRIQFTPDLLPTDVTGVSIYDEPARQFVFVPGPIFANVILRSEERACWSACPRPW